MTPIAPIAAPPRESPPAGHVHTIGRDGFRSCGCDDPFRDDTREPTGGLMSDEFYERDPMWDGYEVQR